MANPGAEQPTLSFSTSTSPLLATDNGPIVKSPNDSRCYRHITLANGLRALLIHDAEADRAAAALDVNIGSLCDPTEIQGLAHFLEHMLFLGTEKYPQEEEYASFMSAHGGGTNAFTSDSHTNYYFYVSHEHLEPGLDRFAQFFLTPLLDPNCTEREINAVDSEHAKNLKQDGWRLSQLSRSTSTPGHMYNRFATGSKATLWDATRARGIDVRAAMLDFYHRYYSANLMCLAVLGRQSLDELQDMVVSKFSAIRNIHASPLLPSEPPLGPAQLARCFYVNPVGETHTVQLSFLIEDETRAFRAQAGHYVSHLIGHEGEGSLLSYLKDKGWATALSSGVYPGIVECFAFFKISITASDLGITSVPAMVRACFQYIDMLRRQGVQEWIFTECKQLLEMNFRFKEKDPPSSYCSNLAGNMHFYPVENTLNHSYIMTDYRPDLISAVLDQLRPRRVRLWVLSKGCAGPSPTVEPWYGTEYREEPLADDFLQELENLPEEPGLVLPPLNEFIPTDFTIHPAGEPSPLPALLRQTPHDRVWFKQDVTFKVPKANVKAAIVSPLAYADPRTANLTRLYVELIKDSLTEFAYAADLAGIVYNFSNTTYGIEMSLTGYTDKLKTMLATVVERMVALAVDPARFAIVKEQYFRFLTNFKTNEPHRRAMYNSSLVLCERIFSHDERLMEFEPITAADLQAFIPLLLGRTYVELFVHGNLTVQHTLDVADLIQTSLSQHKLGRTLTGLEKSLNLRDHILPDRCYYSHCTLSGIHHTSAVDMVFQVGVESIEANCLIDLLCQIISVPCFTQLRTVEQLGYIVHSGARRSGGAQGLRVVVQSEREPLHLEARILAFIDSVEELLVGMTDEDLKKHASAVASRKSEKPKTLIEESMQHWGEISSGYFLFGREKVEVPAVMAITHEQLLAFYRAHLHRDAPHRRIISLRTKPASAPPSAEPDPSTPIVELSEFKHAHALFPLPIPSFLPAKI